MNRWTWRKNGKPIPEEPHEVYSQTLKNLPAIIKGLINPADIRAAKELEETLSIARLHGWNFDAEVHRQYKAERERKRLELKQRRQFIRDSVVKLAESIGARIAEDSSTE